VFTPEGVSCTSATTCAAVGDNGYQTLAMILASKSRRGGGAATRLASAAAKSTAARVPKLGSKAFVPQYGVGWGTYRPSEIFNGGDPTGLVQDIHWSSWGAPTAIGYGTGLYVAPNSDVADGVPARTELRASSLGHCTVGGPLTYRHLEYREPAHPGATSGRWYSWSGVTTLC
jgi:hypothetical protein